jgi:hypothetical protein
MAGPVAGGLVDYHRQPGLPKALQVIADCCRACFAGAAGEAAYEPVGPIDWNELLALAQRHRVEGLVARGLDRLAIGPPPELLPTLQRESSRIAEANLRAADECARLAERFAAGGIDLLFVKGLPLSALAYGDPFIKMSADVDLLVERADLAAAARLLDELGYRMVLPSSSPLDKWHRLHKESLWRGSGTLVELHHRLSDNPALLSEVGMGSARQQVEIFPGSALTTLARDPLIIYIAVHGAASGYFRLKWLADLAALLAGADDAEVDRLQRCAAAGGAGHAFAAAANLAADIFRTPAGVRTAEVARQTRCRWFGRLARRALVSPDEPTEVPLGTLGIRLSLLLLGGSPGYAAGEMVRQLRAMALRS